MQGIFLTYDKLDNQKMTGVDSKIISQIDLFNKNGLNCIPYTLKTNKLTLLEKVLRIFPCSKGKIFWNYDPIFANIDYIYFRRGATATYQMRKMFELIKNNNSTIKIIMEIPSYPYDKEFKGFIGYILLLKDSYNRKRLNNAVDRLAIVSHKIYPRIWGIKTISFINGCDLSKISMRVVKATDVIELICVAVFSPWHGYERIISGMNEYYSNNGNREIIIHMVGEGPELGKYQKLVKKYNLSKNIIFHKHLSGEKLDAVYNRSNLAIASLGLYKIGLDVQNTLKSREYLAKGLPIISGSKVDVLYKTNFKYYCQFPNDSTYIRIQKIIDFYDSIYESQTADLVSRNIRDFAEKEIDINIVMKPIIDYIKNG